MFRMIVLQVPWMPVETWVNVKFEVIRSRRVMFCGPGQLPGAGQHLSWMFPEKVTRIVADELLLTVSAVVKGAVAGSASGLLLLSKRVVPAGDSIFDSFGRPSQLSWSKLSCTTICVMFTALEQDPVLVRMKSIWFSSCLPGGQVLAKVPPG